MWILSRKPSNKNSVCEVVPVHDEPENKHVEPYTQKLETRILETSQGEVVAQIKFYSGDAYAPPGTFTRYGYLIKKIPWAESETAKSNLPPDPADYNVPFKLDVQPSTVYIVKKETTEEGKRALTKILREECGEYDCIRFF